MKKLRMLEIQRTTRMVVLEIDSYDFEENDFDIVWDEVRYIYEEEFYALKKIERKIGKVLVKLTIKNPIKK